MRATATRNLFALGALFACTAAGAQDLFFHPVTPCEALDTRSGLRIAAGETRSFAVTVPPCSVPTSAGAVLVRLTTFAPSRPQIEGSLKAWQANIAEPETVASFPRRKDDRAFETVIPIDGSLASQISVKAIGTATHLHVAVAGYFSGAAPVVVSQPPSIASSAGGPVDLSTGACTAINSASITVPGNGRVIVKGLAQLVVNHGATSGGDRVSLSVDVAGAAICPAEAAAGNAVDFEVPESVAADPSIDATLDVSSVFDVVGAGTKTFYLNGVASRGAGSGDSIQASRLVLMFVPD